MVPFLKTDSSYCKEEKARQWWEPPVRWVKQYLQSSSTCHDFLRQSAKSLATLFVLWRWTNALRTSVLKGWSWSPDSRCVMGLTHGMGYNWPLHSHTVTGLVHVCKVLADAGQLKRLKDTFPALVSARLQVLRDHVLNDSAKQFKSKMLQLFCPPSHQCRRRAVVMLAMEYFNGDWRRTNCLQHVCPGMRCCVDRKHSEAKAVLHLKKLATTLHPRMFNKSNWLHWHTSLAFFGIGTAIHDRGYFRLLFRQLFAGRLRIIQGQRSSSTRPQRMTQAQWVQIVEVSGTCFNRFGQRMLPA